MFLALQTGEISQTMGTWKKSQGERGTNKAGRGAQSHLLGGQKWCNCSQPDVPVSSKASRVVVNQCGGDSIFGVLGEAPPLGNEFLAVARKGSRWWSARLPFSKAFAVPGLDE